MKLVALPAVLAAAALAAGTGPALSAPDGTVIGNVQVAAPPAPCITLSTAAVDFGTLPLSDPAATSTPLVTASPAVHVTSCSIADENLSVAASDATTSSGGTWQISVLRPANTCADGANLYQPEWGSPVGGGFIYGTPHQIPPVLPAGQGYDVRFKLKMPCRGSVGAGETATITFTTLATLA